MKRQTAILVVLLAALAGAAFAGEDRDARDRDFPRLDHVFVIVMENHGFSQILNNPNAPFINEWAKSANLGKNYFAVAHPSLTNYLEIVGGSNFGVLNDHNPDWGNSTCSPNIVSATTSFDTSAFPNICPIWGTGTDAATPVLDPSNEDNPHNSLNNVAGFEALYSDLASGHLPSFSLIAPNQCNDQHGRGNAGPFCNFDPQSNGSQAGLNPALIYLGDVTVQRLVAAIKKSPAWREGNNAIVAVWDENDYSAVPNTNQVVVIVDRNRGPHGIQSSQFYTHFSLLKSIEAGFGLPCLNHACDAGVNVMTDLFGGNQ
jgi:hypothetical protein